MTYLIKVPLVFKQRIHDDEDLNDLVTNDIVSFAYIGKDAIKNNTVCRPFIDEDGAISENTSVLEFGGWNEDRFSGLVALPLNELVELIEKECTDL